MGFIGTRVYIGGINVGGSNVGEKDLFKIFFKYGRIIETIVNVGYGFVVFDTERDALTAVQECDGMRICGRRVNVSISTRPGPKKKREKLGLDRTRGRDKRDRFGKDEGRPFGREREDGDGTRRFGGNSKPWQSQPPPSWRKKPWDVDGGGSGFGGGGKGWQPSWVPIEPTRETRVIVENLSTTVKWDDLNDFFLQRADINLNGVGNGAAAGKDAIAGDKGESKAEGAPGNADGKLRANGDSKTRAKGDASFRPNGEVSMTFGTRSEMMETLKKLDGRKLGQRTIRVIMDVDDDFRSRKREKGDKEHRHESRKSEKKSDHRSRSRSVSSRSSHSSSSSSSTSNSDGSLNWRVE